MTNPQSSLARNATLSALALLGSTTTLVCCVLPAIFVAIGAGAALAGLVTAIPQLIWLSAHKAIVFGGAGLLLAIGAVATAYSRTLPCPTEPAAARACQRLRRFSSLTLAVALACYAVGAFFAFLLPQLGA